jgi:RNA polymerase sigma-70 factor (ECF subfamily)
MESSVSVKPSESIVWTEAQRELLGFVYRRVKDKALAEDIVQDVFVKVYTRIDQLKDNDKLRSWMYQITRNSIADHFRSQQKDVLLDDIKWDSESNPLNECVTVCLQQMISTLPQKYREAFELSEVHNVSQVDLAKRLSISYSGAKSRVQRARQMLREKMEERYSIKMDRYGNVTVCEDRAPCDCAEGTQR